MNKSLRNLNIFNLCLAIFIILWGAWVRLSGSGAGCGDHWPLCNGEVVPLDASVKTLIEYIHRFTSGIFGITVLASVVITRKILQKSFWGKLFAYLTLFFTISEALIGAVLVKKGLVVDNDSILRAWVIGFHLVNTFLLLGALIGQLYFAENKKYSLVPRNKNETYIWALSIILFIFVGATGAIAALGNTLFPETSLVAGILKDFSSSSHILIRLRVLHPLFALALFGLIQYLMYGKNQIYFRWTSHISWVGVIFGAINWMLLAPKWGALLHLFLADALWCLFCYTIVFRYFEGTD